MDDDPFELDRFVRAQAPDIDRVRAELRAGRKASHWMWFIFPQLRALGRSARAVYFGLAGLDEAQAYAAHPVLWPRLVECAALVAAVPDGTADTVMGPVDALKLRSSMTLFHRAVPGEAAFQAVLDRYYGGREDAATLALLGHGVSP